MAGLLSIVCKDLRVIMLIVLALRQLYEHRLKLLLMILPFGILMRDLNTAPSFHWPYLTIKLSNCNFECQLMLIVPPGKMKLIILNS